jgi:hypothetical protein
MVNLLMGDCDRPWRIYEDCLIPLADELFVISRRFSLVSTVKKPPTASDVRLLYDRCRLDVAIDWMKLNVSVEYAEDFHRPLLDIKRRFSTLEFNAYCNLNGAPPDVVETKILRVSYPVQHLVKLHFETHPERPEGNELAKCLRLEIQTLDGWDAEDLRLVIQILDEYDAIEQLIRDTSFYVARVAELLRAKFATVHSEGCGDATAGEAIEPTDHTELISWVSKELKGKQRRVMELVIVAGGEFSLTTIATDAQVHWKPPYDDSFNSIRKVLNSKLKKADLPWRLERNDSKARLSRIGQK